uniref:Uncharacterized protein n=1 Tax=Rhizophora mucronata TaxID=61149 RepID=A0A2P2NIB2_RHIMU
MVPQIHVWFMFLHPENYLDFHPKHLSMNKECKLNMGCLIRHGRTLRAVFLLTLELRVWMV